MILVQHLRTEVIWAQRSSTLKIPKLQQHRQSSRLILFYKIITYYLSLFLYIINEPISTPTESLHHATTAHKPPLTLTRTTSIVEQFKDWNYLSNWTNNFTYSLNFKYCKYTGFSIIRTPFFLKLGKSVQISEFVWITESHWFIYRTLCKYSNRTVIYSNRTHTNAKIF